MHRVERIVLYVALSVALFAAFARPDRVGADAPANGAFGVVTATELRIVASDGTVLAVVGADDLGGSLSWSTKDGKRAGALRTNANGGYASLRNVDDKEVVFVGAPSDAKMGVVSVCEAKGMPRAELIGRDSGAGEFMNADGKMVAFVGGATESKVGLFILYDATGARRTIEASSLAAGGYVVAKNADDKQAVWLGADDEKESGIVQVNRRDGTRGGALAP